MKAFFATFLCISALSFAGDISKGLPKTATLPDNTEIEIMYPPAYATANTIYFYSKSGADVYEATLNPAEMTRDDVLMARVDIYVGNNKDKSSASSPNAYLFWYVGSFDSEKPSGCLWCWRNPENPENPNNCGVLFYDDGTAKAAMNQGSENGIFVPVAKDGMLLGVTETLRKSDGTIYIERFRKITRY